MSADASLTLLLFICMSLILTLVYSTIEVSARARAFRVRVRFLLLLLEVNVMFCSNYRYVSCFCPPSLEGGRGEDRTGDLLDLPVRTDTKGVSLGGLGGSPTRVVCCEICGLPLKRCRCRVTVDY